MKNRTAEGACPNDSLAVRRDIYDKAVDRVCAAVRIALAWTIPEDGFRGRNDAFALGDEDRIGLLVDEGISSAHVRRRQHVCSKLTQALLSQIHDPGPRARRGSWQIGDYEQIAGPRGRNVPQPFTLPLEARVGVRLLDRNPRSVALTEEGRRFHAQVAPLLAGLEEAAADAAGSAARVTGRLRVSVDPWFVRMVLAPHLPRFMAKYPLLSVDLTTSNYREEMMAGVDVAVRFGPPDVASLISRKIAETRVLTCAAPAYLAEYGEPKTPHDLAHHECLLFRDPQTGRPFTWEFQRGGEVIEVNNAGRLVMDDASAAVGACAAGQGIFQSLEMGLGPWLASGQLVQILSDWADERYPLYAYHPSRHLPPAKVRAFLDFVQEITRED